MSLDREHFRADIVIGAEAMRLAVESFGRDGVKDDEVLMNRAKKIYRWLYTERKTG